MTEPIPEILARLDLAEGRRLWDWWKRTTSVDAYRMLMDWRADHYEDLLTLAEAVPGLLERCDEERRWKEIAASLRGDTHREDAMRAERDALKAEYDALKAAYDELLAHHGFEHDRLVTEVERLRGSQ